MVCNECWGYNKNECPACWGYEPAGVQDGVQDEYESEEVHIIMDSHLRDIIADKKWEARDETLRIVLNNYDEWVKPENRRHGTLFDNFRDNLEKEIEQEE